tara:strand:+ start:2566 stop:2808 length:243 start_codon:yes stop_codon:yes gene_type:complete
MARFGIVDAVRYAPPTVNHYVQVSIAHSREQAELEYIARLEGGGRSVMVTSDEYYEEVVAPLERALEVAEYYNKLLGHIS